MNRKKIKINFKKLDKQKRLLQYEYVIWDIELRRIINVKYVAPAAELVSLEITAVIMNSPDYDPYYGEAAEFEEEEYYCEEMF